MRINNFVKLNAEKIIINPDWLVNFNTFYGHSKSINEAYGVDKRDINSKKDIIVSQAQPYKFDFEEIQIEKPKILNPKPQIGIIKNQGSNGVNYEFNDYLQTKQKIFNQGELLDYVLDSVFNTCFGEEKVSEKRALFKKKYQF